MAHIHLVQLERANSGDSYNEDQCSGTYLGEMTADVWFSYTACGSGSMTVSTCDIVDASIASRVSQTQPEINWPQS